MAVAVTEFSPRLSARDVRLKIIPVGLLSIIGLGLGYIGLRATGTGNDLPAYEPVSDLGRGLRDLPQLDVRPANFVDLMGWPNLGELPENLKDLVPWSVKPPENFDSSTFFGGRTLVYAPDKETAEGIAQTSTSLEVSGWFDPRIEVGIPVTDSSGNTYNVPAQKVDPKAIEEIIEGAIKQGETEVPYKGSMRRLDAELAAEFADVSGRVLEEVVTQFGSVLAENNIQIGRALTLGSTIYGVPVADKSDVDVYIRLELTDEELSLPDKQIIELAKNKVSEAHRLFLDHPVISQSVKGLLSGTKVQSADVIIYVKVPERVYGKPYSRDEWIPNLSTSFKIYR